MTDRSSISALRGTLTPTGGRPISGWESVTYPDHDLPTGTYAPATGGSQEVTVGTLRASGDYVLTKKFDAAEFAAIEQANPDASLVIHVVDRDNRPISTVRRTTGVIKGITPSGQDRKSGDPLMMMVRYTGRLV